MLLRKFAYFCGSLRMLMIDRLATLYNSINGQQRRDAVAEWAKIKYPEVWADVEKLGKKEVDDGWGGTYWEIEWKRNMKA